MRVVVADDSELMREALAYLLRSIEHVELVATCDDADSLAAAVATERPDVVVLDVGLSGSEAAGGVTIADRLREAAADFGLIEIGHQALLRVRRDGDRQRYLHKDELVDRDRLAAALHEVARTGP